MFDGNHRTRRNINLSSATKRSSRLNRNRKSSSSGTSRGSSTINSGRRGNASEILEEALKTLDLLGVFQSHDNTNPFLLVDGHGSRFEIPFLPYINDPSHQWVFCIGVPYRTSYQQVGDRKEQNGSFNIAITKAKEEILKQRQAK